MGGPDVLNARGYQGPCPLQIASPEGNWPTVEYQGVRYEFLNPGILTDKEIFDTHKNDVAMGMSEPIVRTLMPRRINIEGYTKGPAVGISKTNGLPITTTKAKDAGVCAFIRACDSLPGSTSTAALWGQY